jgi:hypothetical protein
MDLTNRIAKSAFVEGAYTGRNTTKKPENYGSRAIPWDEFAAFVDQQIGRHNAKLGRRGRDYKGRSFDDVFADPTPRLPSKGDARAAAQGAAGGREQAGQQPDRRG